MFPAGPDGTLLTGRRTAGVGGGDWTWAGPDCWLYDGTGMKDGEQVAGHIGWENHGSQVMDLPGMEASARSEIKGGNRQPRAPHVATVCYGAGGNVVFRCREHLVGAGFVFTTRSRAPREWRRAVPDPRASRMPAILFAWFLPTTGESRRQSQAAGSLTQRCISQGVEFHAACLQI